jgi:hypothetical protein
VWVKGYGSKVKVLGVNRLGFKMVGLGVQGLGYLEVNGIFGSMG